MRDRIVAFGEIMLRVCPLDPGEKIHQARIFRIEPGGSESNLAVALAKLGHKVSLMTKISNNELKSVILQYLRQHNVDTSCIAIGDNRIGMYWTEHGIGPRASCVIYDREGSAFSTARLNDFDLSHLKDAYWFHVSGVTPAISSRSCRNVYSLLDMLRQDQKISVDLNYRNKLWRWILGRKSKKIYKIMNDICAKAYLITGNESDFQDALACPVPEGEAVTSYKQIGSMLFDKFQRLRFIAVSLRTSHSASHNDWSGILLAKTVKGIECFKGPQYVLDCIIDRIGTGDSFTAGIIHGILTFKNDLQHVIDFATALSALKHTVLGDASSFSQEEVEQVIAANGSGRIIR